MDKFKNLSIRNKILFFIVSSFIIAMLSLTVVVIYQFEDLATDSNQRLKKVLLTEEKQGIRSNVQLLAGTLAKVNTTGAEELSTERMRKIVSQNQVNYNETDYFYILNFEGKMIAHGAQPALVGENLWDIKKRDQAVVQKIINQVVEKGGGFVTYYWDNPKNGAIEEKISYVQQIPGTSYLLGSGQYKSVINELLSTRQRDINEARNETIAWFLSIVLLITLLLGFISSRVFRYLVVNINKILAGVKQVAEGDLKTQLDITSQDELGKLAKGFNKMVREIDDLTYNDLLTGLPNKDLFIKKLTAKLDKLDEGKNLFLCALAIDNYRIITDTYGHQTGDLLLKNVAQRLRNNLETEIIVSRNKEEFLFYYRGRLDEEKVVEKLEEIIEQIEHPYNINNQLIYVTVDAGISIFPDDSQDVDVLIKNASLALHNSANSNNDISFYARSMNDKIAMRVNLESKLRVAIEEEQFRLHYQPFVDRDGQIVGMEALIRWQHPQEGMISPGEFIPVAEETGLIIEIGEWVLKEACRQLKRWQNYGYQDLYISVNIAPQQFREVDFVEKIKDVLNVTGIAGEKLELEITERTAVSDINYTIEVLKKLQNLGVRIAIDDFGTGYSSLSFLKDFAINVLKIDQSFVHQLEQNEKNQSIAETIIDIGNNLDLEVVAEGVETEAEKDFLEAKGCDIMQGYLFSRPVSEHKFLEILEEKKDS